MENKSCFLINDDIKRPLVTDFNFTEEEQRVWQSSREKSPNVEEHLLLRVVVGKKFVEDANGGESYQDICKNRETNIYSHIKYSINIRKHIEKNIRLIH